MGHAGQDPGPPRMVALPGPRVGGRSRSTRSSSGSRRSCARNVPTSSSRSARTASPGIRITSRSAGPRRAAFHALRADGLDGFRRLIHVALPAVDAGHVERAARSRRDASPWIPRSCTSHVACPTRPSGSASTRAPSRNASSTRSRDHRTQASDFDSLLSDEERLDAAARAYGIVAWPPWEPGDDVVTDAFEGLTDRARRAIGSADGHRDPPDRRRRVRGMPALARAVVQRLGHPGGHDPRTPDPRGGSVARGVR